MVSRSAGTSIRYSNRTTQTSRSAATTAFPSVSRKSPYASSDCVATLRRFASQAGFSATVAGQLALCRRKSTRLNYQARWGKFRQWCRGFHHRSSEPVIPKIAEFLTFLFKTEKAAVSTIKDYRAMLSSGFKFYLPEISSSPILKDLVRSFEISAPRPLHHSPPWDLDKVLEYLSGPPFFEPLAEASFRNKTRKALFLLAMTTAKCIGELQALSFSVSHRGDDLVLHYDPFFLAKTESVSKPLPRSVIVQSLADFVGDLPERVLCPVRAISCLRRAARSVEFTPSSLFVSPSDPKRTTSKNAMSFFLRQLITESGAMLSLVPQRTHDIQGIATSLNYYSILSISAVKRQLHGSLTSVCQEILYRHVYHLIKAPRCGPPDRRWLCCKSTLINGSLGHVYLSPCTIMATWAYIGKVPTKNLLYLAFSLYEQFPFKSHPILALP